MGPPSYMRSVVDRNVVMRCILVSQSMLASTKHCIPCSCGVCKVNHIGVTSVLRWHCSVGLLVWLISVEQNWYWLTFRLEFNDRYLSLQLWPLGLTFIEDWMKCSVDRVARWLLTGVLAGTISWMVCSVRLHCIILRLPVPPVFLWYIKNNILMFGIRVQYVSRIVLTLIPLTWRIWWANNASRWQMGFNSEFNPYPANVENMVSS